MITIGRAGTDFPLNGARAGHGSISAAGDEVTIEGVIAPTATTPAVTTAIARHQREQILALAGNPDEETVPIVDTLDAHLNGSWRVVSSTVDDPEMPDQVHFEWTVKAVRLADGWQMPRCEVQNIGADRDNAHALTGNGWVGVPGSSIARSGLYLSSSATASLVGGGTVVVDENDGHYADTITYIVDPASFYEAAPLLTMDDRSIIGRQVARDGDAWILSNGLVKIRPSLTTINHLIVGIRNAGATDYDEVAYRLGYQGGVGGTNEFGYDGSTRYAPAGIVVLRNSPEIVAIRLIYPNSANIGFGGAGGGAGAGVPLYLDVTLRRGQGYADFVLGLDSGDAFSFGVWRAVTDVSASITGGVEDNAAVGGIKWRIYTPLDRTADNVNGGLYSTAAVAAFPFAIGNDQTYTRPTVDAYFAAQEHIQTVLAA